MILKQLHIIKIFIVMANNLTCCCYSVICKAGAVPTSTAKRSFYCFLTLMEFTLKMVSALVSFAYMPNITIITHTYICYHFSKGIVNGFPRFVEQNKVRGEPYEEIIPAEIIYCSDIKSWVFWHPNINTSPPNKPENEVRKILLIH